MAIFLSPLIVAVNIPQTFKLFSSHECRFFHFFRTGKFSLCPSWIERFHHPVWVRFSTVRCLAKHLPHRIRNLHLLSRFHHVFQITFYFCMPLPNERLWNTFYIWCFLQGTFLYWYGDFPHLKQLCLLWSSLRLVFPVALFCSRRGFVYLPERMASISLFLASILLLNSVCCF